MKNCKMEELAGVLLTCGYHARQIQQIVDEAREGGKTGEEQENAIIESLQTYVEFATQCKRMRHGKR